MSEEMNENKYFPIENSLLQRPIVKIANIQHRENKYRFNKHIHDNFEMYLILEGTCNMDIGLKSVTCHAGQIIMIIPNIPHSFYLKANESCSFIHVHFYPDIFSLLKVDTSFGYPADILSLIQLYQNTYYLNDADETITKAMHHLVDLASSILPYSTACSNLAIIELMIYIIELHNKEHLYFQSNTEQNELVYFTLKYIHENYGSKFLIEQIADELNVSSRYLRKLFVQSMNINIQSYVKIYRMNKAVELMGLTDLNLTEIAAAVGINDSQYFSKLFHNTIGSAPSEYRKILKQLDD